MADEATPRPDRRNVTTDARHHSSGQLLSETDTGVDYLEAAIYANAIAESIHDARTSITIGIYAKWGSGKSFLLKHIESVLQRFQKQDEQDKEADPEAEYECYRSKRFLCWSLTLAITFLVFIVSVIMAADPAFFYRPIQTVTPQDNSANNALNITTTTTVTPSASDLAEAKRLQALNTIKIVGCVLIPVEIISVFLIASFGVWPSSQSSCGRMRILAYSIFTKIPIQRNAVDIVEDPGESPDELLRNVAPGDELLAMAATTAVRFPRKYIFVNFKAWEYAGSDTLWAAIVTNISDAIEAEFGVTTTRLFRTISVAEVPKKHLGESKRALYIKFESGTSPDEIKNVMKRYGVVTSIKSVDSRDASFRWFEIVYSTDGEFRNAKDSLTIEGVTVLTSPPDGLCFRRNGNARESSQPLLHQPSARGNDDIRLANLKNRSSEGDNTRINMPQGESAPKLEAVSKLFCCCQRFCTHFMRYPITLCKLPRLFWWIILIVASLLIPIIAYIVADVLNIRTAQTFWRVPPYAQVLLWLPGPISVAVFLARFSWALCHSQTRRIHQALDGIQGKMASQLGFMSTVKQEVAVMTSLIRCARFVLQKDYRVIITIDDLDQVNLKKVHAVLEAVSILLSDKTSPFICLIAADPRIVVKCVEENLGDVLKSADVSGREYLKKIVNLPVCLPELNEPIKKRYIAGLIDQSDATIHYTKEHTRNVNGESPEEVIRSGEDEIDGMMPTTSYATAAQDIGRERFLFFCRKCLYDDEDLRRHIDGNARNVKRIFNVISLTSCLIHSIVKKQELKKFVRQNMHGDRIHATAVEGFPTIVRTKELAEKLVHWLVLVDEWPYRTSFIVQVIYDADQREVAGLTDTKIPKDWTILKIYLERVQNHLEEPDIHLVTLDGDPDLFQTYLLLLGSRGFKKSDILFLIRLTINLDNSIRRRIGLKLVPPPIHNSNRPIENRRDNDVTTNTISMHSVEHPPIELRRLDDMVGGSSADDTADTGEDEMDMETTC